MSKIPCGGFELGEGLTLNGKTLSATGGGGAVTAQLDIKMEFVEDEVEFNVLSSSMSILELKHSFEEGKNVLLNIRFIINGNNFIMTFPIIASGHSPEADIDFIYANITALDDATMLGMFFSVTLAGAITPDGDVWTVDAKPFTMFISE